MKETGEDAARLYIHDIDENPLPCGWSEGLAGVGGPPQKNGDRLACKKKGSFSLPCSFSLSSIHLYSGFAYRFYCILKLTSQAQ